MEKALNSSTVETLESVKSKAHKLNVKKEIVREKSIRWHHET